jgi:hypothetical protein
MSYMIDIPGAAMCYFDGTGAAQEYMRDDRAAVEGPAWVALGKALKQPQVIKRGVGETYRVNVPTLEALKVMQMYAETCPSLTPERGFAQDPSERREASAVRKVIARIETAITIGPV